MRNIYRRLRWIGYCRYHTGTKLFLSWRPNSALLGGLFCLFLVLGIIACSQGTPCPGLDPFCKREATAEFDVKPSATISVGETVTFDASDSIFDDIFWYIGGQPIQECRGSDTCSLVMNTIGVFEISIRVKVAKVGFHPESEDNTKKSITVVEATSSAVDCPLGESAYDGIAIFSEDDKCLVMETTDRAQCRSNSSPTYDSCQVWSQAATTCPAGTTSGSDWYLPTETELDKMISYTGSGSPLSSNGICVGNSSPCLSDPVSLDTVPESFYKIPYAYWSSTESVSGKHIALNFNTKSTFATNDNDSRLSVRCVKWVSP